MELGKNKTIKNVSSLNENYTNIIYEQEQTLNDNFFRKNLLSTETFSKLDYLLHKLYYITLKTSPK